MSRSRQSLESKAGAPEQLSQEAASRFEKELEDRFNAGYQPGPDLEFLISDKTPEGFMTELMVNYLLANIEDPDPNPSTWEPTAQYLVSAYFPKSVRVKRNDLLKNAELKLTRAQASMLALKGAKSVKGSPRIHPVTRQQAFNVLEQLINEGTLDEDAVKADLWDRFKNEQKRRWRRSTKYGGGSKKRPRTETKRVVPEQEAGEEEEEAEPVEEGKRPGRRSYKRQRVEVKPEPVEGPYFGPFFPQQPASSRRMSFPPLQMPMQEAKVQRRPLTPPEIQLPGPERPPSPGFPITRRLQEGAGLRMRSNVGVAPRGTSTSQAFYYYY